MLENSLWGDLFREPIFILTADQDWAPEWMMEDFLGEIAARELPLHLFVTNESAAMRHWEERKPDFTLGLHPNFLPGTTHGRNVEEILAHCRALVPEATTVRCHCCFEDSRILDYFARQGLRTDSNCCLFSQPGIEPLLQGMGILRFPYFFEDDVFFSLAGPELDLEPLSEVLFSPGLKIIDVHPLFTALNAPSQTWYDGVRGKLRGEASEKPVYDGRGAATVLWELVAKIRDGGGTFQSFPEVAAMAWRHLEHTRPAYLYDWGRRSLGLPTPRLHAE